MRAFVTFLAVRIARCLGIDCTPKSSPLLLRPSHLSYGVRAGEEGSVIRGKGPGKQIWPDSLEVRFFEGSPSSEVKKAES